MKKLLIFLPPLLLFAILFFPSKKKNGMILNDEISSQSSSIKKTKTSPEKTPESKIETISQMPDHQREVEAVLAATNLWEDLKSIDGLMEDRLDKARELLPPEEYEKLEKVIQESFSSAKFIEAVKNHLAEKLTSEDLEDLKKLTEDPFLKRVWEIQAAASSPEGLKEMAEFAKEYTPAPERDKLIKDYEIQTQATNKMLDLNGELLKGIFIGASPKEIPTEQLEKIASAITEKIKPSIEKEVRLRFQYTYQDLSPQELKRLLEIDNNPTLTKTENLVQEKLKELLHQGGIQMGKTSKGRQD
jgi:hypothetical protein